MSRSKGDKEEEMSAANATVARCWGEAVEVRARVAQQGWLDSPLVWQEVLQRRMPFLVASDWLATLLQHLEIPQGGHWLSLGCGTAHAEIGASLDGHFESMRALDIADHAIQEARRQAAARGAANIEFEVVDLNHLVLPRATFDVVVMAMSLHHVAELERLMKAVRAALAPSGWFLINEFVGPCRLQYTNLQLGLVRELLVALPDRLRMDSDTGRLKTEYVRRPVEEWLRIDPSEAVRSDRIVPLARRYFDVRLQIDYGGTLLNPLLEHIVHNFEPGDEAAVSLMRMLGRCEDVAITHGLVGNDFSILALRPRAWRRRLAALRRRLPRCRAEESRIGQH